MLTKTWTDWIDYWAVDFDFESRPEIDPRSCAGRHRRAARAGRSGPAATSSRTSGSRFRTRKRPHAGTDQRRHEYATKGRHKIAVKVIDIFGNDTTKVVEVTV